MIANEHQVVEVLEDGTIYAFDLEVCDKEAERVLKNLHRKEGKLFNFDYGATLMGFLAYKAALLAVLYDEIRNMILSSNDITLERKEDDPRKNDVECVVITSAYSRKSISKSPLMAAQAMGISDSLVVDLSLMNI